MQINISARHGHLSAATQDKVTEKVEKLQKYHERVTAIHVTVDLEHREAPSVEVRVSVEHSAECVATESAENLLAALDGAVHKVEGQLRKNRDKQVGHRKPGIKHLEATSESEQE
ncbi:MAG: ribosome-associated translation inhibitor RaiA [Pirellulales bacterium]